MSTDVGVTGRQARWRVLLRRCAALPLRLLLPPCCLLCGGRGQPPATDLCAACAAELPCNQVACRRCAMPLEQLAGSPRCGACLRHPPRFDAALCPFHYAYPVDHMVRALKYHGGLAYARILGELLAARARVESPLPELLLPVPLADARFRERGYNQAIELGVQLERLLGIELRADVLERTRETSEQAGLARRERRRNIRGAFALLRPIRARHVALIDDVMTTGSTVNELAKVLKAGGVKRVDVWAIARAHA